MASIHTPGVAAASRSGYSARPDRLDHEAYGIEHVLYSRRTPRRPSSGSGERRQIGHPPGGQPSGATRPRGTAEDAGTGTGVTRRRRGHPFRGTEATRPP
ncbi:hypothetical protein CFC35_10755 [Streptomyces sp. FBKL.4005]|nr:hypothetical protein CFC35_10755 [Streptomyces sp. FBKL.4005]